ncbi:MAG: 1-acyl-sn-glycerol-3-phosphate acyltransferase [Acidobacteria bacterium]|nr:1-acyl-sn-glycerol-3-phosphate acyltransferase [Acidobacteriota bacterium]
MADQEQKNLGNEDEKSELDEKSKSEKESQALVKTDSKPNVGASMTTKVGVGFGLALGITAISSYVIFRLMNRVKVEGLENIPTEHENVLYCLNHNSMLDNFAFETTVYLPKIFFKPEYLPVNLADRKNFFGDPASRKFKDKVMRLLGKHFFTHLRAYPVDRQGGDMGQVDKWVELLKHNIVVVFPEGTRSRTGQIAEGKPGVGKMIYQARPTVIPVRMIGMDEVLAVGKIIPRAFRTVHIVIGKPMDLTEWINYPLPSDPGECYGLFKGIADEVIDAIKALKPSGK